MKFIGSKELLILYRIKRNGTVQLKSKRIPKWKRLCCSGSISGLLQFYN